MRIVCDIIGCIIFLVASPIRFPIVYCKYVNESLNDSRVKCNCQHILQYVALYSTFAIMTTLFFIPCYVIYLYGNIEEVIKARINNE